MEIFKWQIKMNSIVYSQRPMGVSGLSIYTIMLPSSDFSIAHYFCIKM